jgi:hypothetical protein
MPFINALADSAFKRNIFPGAPYQGTRGCDLIGRSEQRMLDNVGQIHACNGAGV